MNLYASEIDANNVGSIYEFSTGGVIPEPVTAVGVFTAVIGLGGYIRKRR